MKKLCAILIIIFLTIACSKKEDPKLRDNITSKKPVAPIAEAESIKIDEGNRYFLNGNFEKAIEFYTKGLQENRALAFYNLGVANYLLGRYKQSEEYFREAIKEKKDFKDAYINLSATLLKLKKYDEAAQVISNIEPSNAKEYQIAAEIYSIINDSPRAYYYYEKFSKFKDALPSGFINYGLFLKNIGEEEKGNAIINKTIEKIESIETKEYEEYFQLASAYFAIKNYDKALYYAKTGLNMKKTYEILEIMMRIYEIQGRFDLASIAAENMLSINTDESTYVHYIRNLIKSANYTAAEENLKDALTKYPRYQEFFKLYHKLAILTGDLVKANLIARKGYEVVNDDDMAYFYARHSILYDNNFDNAKKMIGIIKNSDRKNILNAMLMIKFNNLSGAEEKLKNVSDKNSFDYNFLDTFIKLTRKEYKDAETSAEKMDDDVVEKFFYKFIIYFNTKQFEKLANLAKSNALFVKNIKRYPKISLNITPTFEDLQFSFVFDGDFESILRLILTPIFIDPEEMTNYLATGYTLLKQSDQLLALNELKKSLNLSNGIKHNNNGVKAMLNFDYVTGNRELAEAVNYLGDNPIVYYNIGVLMLNLGDINKAYDFFDNALLNNKFIFPAYLGKAVCLNLMDEKNRVSAQYDMLIGNYNILENNEKKQALPYYYTKLLAFIGSKKYSEVKDAVKDSDLKLHKSIKELALAIRDKNFEKFTSSDLAFHRSDTLKALLNLYYKNITAEKFPKHDRTSDYMLYNTSLKKGKNYKISSHELDKYLEIENLKYSIFSGEENILEKLKRLAAIDKNDPNLFKLSLYYFTLKRDVINAEISLQNLKKSNMDKTSLYYQMLYHLITNNNFNINKSISKYIEVAPNDYRGYMVELLKGFRENNLQTAYDNAIRLSKADLKDKKIPLEIVINGL